VAFLKIDENVRRRAPAEDAGRWCVGRRRNKMANKQAKKALEQFKMQAASEVGVNLNQGYNGDLTARQAGSIGGQMVKKMIKSYEESMK
jgi:hypothetical protein